MIYLGVRVEINSKNIKDKNFQSNYNKSGSAKIFDLCENGRVALEKKNELLLVCGKKDKNPSNLTNFSLLVELKKSKSDLERIVKIINVLGNDKLIKEKAKAFVSGQSILNNIVELEPLKQAFKEVSSRIPNFMELAWYYAPEIKIEE